MMFFAGSDILSAFLFTQLLMTKQVVHLKAFGLSTGNQLWKMWYIILKIVDSWLIDLNVFMIKTVKSIEWSN